MWSDPIVEEIHAIREQLLSQFGGDLHKLCEYARVQSTTPVATDTQPVPSDLSKEAGPAGTSSN